MKTLVKKLGVGAALASLGLAAQAQSSVTLYGVLDQYLNYMHSGSGATVKSLEDGAWLRSRFGVRGQEDLGGGMFAKFQMEGGFSTDTGAQADGGRFWDRQAWVGLGTADLGEVRIGRQNGPIQSHGAYIDYTWRDLGSVINNFGVPSRYDNDLSYLSPRWSGFAFEAHAALPESPVGNHPMILQGWLDWTNDVFRVGYIGLRALPPSNVSAKDVIYDNVYGNWMYGNGTVYLAYVHSNNVKPSGTAAAGTLNPTGTQILPNAGTGLTTTPVTPGYNDGSNANLNNFYDIWQISADYKVTPAMRAGFLWGQIKDKSGRDQGATGGSVGVYYDLSKRTMLWAMADTIKNQTNGGWKPQGSAGLKTTFTTTNDVVGRTINGLEVGIVHRF